MQKEGEKTEDNAQALLEHRTVPPGQRQPTVDYKLAHDLSNTGIITSQESFSSEKWRFCYDRLLAGLKNFGYRSARVWIRNKRQSHMGWGTVPVRL